MNFILKNIYTILLSLLCIFYFYGAGTFEVQPWDEAMYAVRARAVQEHGAILDQTEYSCGGLYSSVHPPLSIWISALNFELFGRSEITVRLWSILAGCGVLLLIYYLTGGGFIGLGAAILMAFNLVQYYFTRLGQLDAPMQFFMLLSIFFWINYIKNKRTINIWMTGIAFGFCLMSKAVFGVLVPAVISVWLVYLITQKEISISKAIKDFAIVFLTGSAIALPWHLYMYVKHGGDFLNFFIFYHVMQRFESGVEQNTRSLGMFFYLNQFISIYSFFLLFLIQSICRIKKNKSLVFVLIALTIIFILFSISKTKMFSYMFTMFPLLVILIADGIRKIKEEKQIKVLWIIVACILAVWSFSQELRIAVKHLVLLQPNYSAIFISAAIIALILGWIYRNKTLKLGLPLIALMLTYFIIKFIFSINFYIYKTDIKKYSELFFKEKYSKLIYIDAEKKSYTYDPQITYYFDMVDKMGKNKFEYIKPGVDVVSSLDLSQSKEMVIINNREYLPQQASFNKIVKENANLIGSDSVYSYYLTK